MKPLKMAAKQIKLTVNTMIVLIKTLSRTTSRRPSQLPGTRTVIIPSGSAAMAPLPLVTMRLRTGRLQGVTDDGGYR